MKWVKNLLILSSEHAHLQEILKLDIRNVKILWDQVNDENTARNDQSLSVTWDSARHENMYLNM